MKFLLKRSRIICLLTAAVIFMCAFLVTGCDDSGEEEQIAPPDPNRTQLYVGNYDGGIGDEWLKEAKVLFEAENPQIEIRIINDKNSYEPGNLFNGIKSSGIDMYCLNSNDYHLFVNSKHFLEVTEIVTAGGEKSIENRMNDSLRSYYKRPDGKYFGVPFFEAFFHMIYDVDLFDSELLWLNESGTGFVNSLTEARYPGESGKAGAWDEGLPKTYSQFFMLLEEMYTKGITGVTWSGAKKDQYVLEYLTNLCADYQGAEVFAANYSLDGDTQVLKNYDFTESAERTFSLPAGVTETVRMNKSNAQTVMPMQTGRYYATKFAHDLMGSGRKYVNERVVNSPSELHMMAQSTFLRSRYLGKPIGMFIEGGWWFNEANVTMTEMARDYDEMWSAKNRRFGVMPFPKADDGSSAAGRTVGSRYGSSSVVISSYTTVPDIAKKFFEFINSEEMMRKFTVTTNVKRPYEYELSAEEKSQLSYYINNVIEMTDETTIQYMLPSREELYDDFTFLDGAKWQLLSLVNVDTYVCPTTAFFDNQSLTAKQYFEGLSRYQQINKYEF